MIQGDKLRLRITGINNEGEGVVRTPEDGFVLFVPSALPDEEVTVRVVSLKKNYGTAKVIERHSDSRDRTVPRCPAFGNCGGCQLQHMSYEAQLRLKTQTVYDALRRIGGIDEPPVEKCVPSPSQWGYRNKASLPVQRNAKRKFIAGFYKPRSHDVVPFTSCPVLLPKIEKNISQTLNIFNDYGFAGYDERCPHDAINFMRHIVFRSARFTNDSLCGVIANRRPDATENKRLSSLADKLPSVGGVALNVNRKEGNFIWGDEFSTITPPEVMEEDLGGRRFRFEVSSFFQINSEQTLNLYNFAASQALSTAPKNVLELYSGVGSLTAFLASGAERVTAVESWIPAAKYITENAALNGLTNITIHSAQAEDLVKNLSDSKYDTIVLDPPRTGCAPEVINFIANAKPEKIVYVSCNPATLARDIKPLIANHYKLITAQPFDMFPQTGHVETVAVLSRGNGN